MGGQPLVRRLGDKTYSWNGVASLVPSMVSAGLLGYSYTCPDMIGGGEYSSFLGIDASSFDQTLIVRSCQIHSMMPMMQFSVAPWRILNKKIWKRVLNTQMATNSWAIIYSHWPKKHPLRGNLSYVTWNMLSPIKDLKNVKINTCWEINTW